MPDPLPMMPDEIRKGDSFTVKFSDGTYPAPTWTLTAYLVGATNNANVVATADGTDHLLSFTTAFTDALTVEDTSWEWKVTDSTDVVTVDDGRLSVTANFATVGASDQRSHARKVLDLIRAVIEKRATKDQLEYAIKDRSIKKMTVEDLMELENEYAKRVANEERNEKGQGNKLAKVRFNTP